MDRWSAGDKSCAGRFFFSSRRRHTRWPRDWSSDVCSSDLAATETEPKDEARLGSRGGRRGFAKRLLQIGQFAFQAVDFLALVAYLMLFVVEFLLSRGVARKVRLGIISVLVEAVFALQEVEIAERVLELLFHPSDFLF